MDAEFAAKTEERRKLVEGVGMDGTNSTRSQMTLRRVHLARHAVPWRAKYVPDSVDYKDQTPLHLTSSDSVLLAYSTERTETFVLGSELTFATRNSRVRNRIHKYRMTSELSGWRSGIENLLSGNGVRVKLHIT